MVNPGSIKSTGENEIEKFPSHRSWRSCTAAWWVGRQAKAGCRQRGQQGLGQMPLLASESGVLLAFVAKAKLSIQTRKSRVWVNSVGFLSKRCTRRSWEAEERAITRELEKSYQKHICDFAGCCLEHALSGGPSVSSMQVSVTQNGH